MVYEQREYTYWLNETFKCLRQDSTGGLLVVRDEHTQLDIPMIQFAACILENTEIFLILKKVTLFMREYIELIEQVKRSSRE